ncbi:MAG: hypothetical protein N2C14_30385 [Planctomycetales bacterium]
MPKFLVRDYDDPSGYKVTNKPLERSRQVSYVPWALTQDGTVVYAKTGEHRGWPNANGLSRYDSLTSQNRQRLCQSILGGFALKHHEFTQKSVEQVSSGVKNYLLRMYSRDRNGTLDFFKSNVGKYLFSTIPSFGRLELVTKSAFQNKNAQTVWFGALQALASGSIQQILAIHDGVGRKMLWASNDKATLKTSPEAAKFFSPEYFIYRRKREKVRADWYDDERRGRAKSPSGRPKPCTSLGITNLSQATKVDGVDQTRVRGVDSWIRIPRLPNRPWSPTHGQKDADHWHDSDAYYYDMDERNLIFGAGPSGTTGTLLCAAFAFSKMPEGGELMKQYLFAIIGYLIGGGMHSIHESLLVASKVSLPYKDVLPNSFLESPQYKNWRDEFYDVVELGGLHWLYNNLAKGADHQTATHH